MNGVVVVVGIFLCVLDEEEDFESEESDEEGKGEKKGGSAKKARMSVCDTFF